MSTVTGVRRRAIKAQPHLILRRYPPDSTRDARAAAPGWCALHALKGNPVLNTAIFVALYYLGFGFVIFLGWACIVDAAGPSVDQVRRNRLHRLAIGLATAGVLHPGFALAGRDLAAQLDRADGPHDPSAARTTGITTWGLAVALTVAATVVASQLGPLEDAQVLRQIRRALPFT